MTSLMAELQSWKTALADSTADSLYNTYTVCRTISSSLSLHVCMYIHYDIQCLIEPVYQTAHI